MKKSSFFKILSICWLIVFYSAFFGYYVWKISLTEKIIFSIILIAVGIITTLIFLARFKNYIGAIFQIGLFGMLGFILTLSSLIGVDKLSYRILGLFFGILSCLISVFLFINNFIRKKDALLFGGVKQ